MRAVLLPTLVVVVVSLVMVAGCSDAPAPEALTMDAAELERWEIALVEWRIEKNEVFMDPAQTPLPESARGGFEGLDYYFPADEFRYRVPLMREARPDTVQLAKAQGGDAPYVAVGKVRFRHGGQDLSLMVYGPTGAGAGSLFLPFHDLTNGETTYPGGRYLDLDLGDDGMVELDFNRAYNPLCAYGSDRWNCTLPPAENRLPIRVEAGEKLLAGVTH